MPITLRLFSGVLLFLALSILPVSAFSLAEVEEDVKSDYPSVKHVTPDDLAASPGESGIVLFDVREKSEFTVSHLPDAVRIDPDLDRETFLQRYRDRIAGKRVVFYCSVGVRSSQMAERLKLALQGAGAKSAANLSGGIFRWHNERRELKNASGQTDAVHPYNARWGRLLRRKDRIRYRPLSAQ